MIKIIKLSNSVEVVGEWEAETQEYVVLNKPLQINYKYFVNSTPSVWFIRYGLFADSHSITFDKKHIINEMKARPTFEEFYKKNVVFHYEELEPHIDTELINAVQSEPKSPSTKTSEEDLMKFLESLSMDGAQAN